MRAGMLNSQITIQKKTRLSDLDEAGQPIYVWSVVCASWANIRHRGGLETIRNAADVSTVQASIRIRYRNGLDATMRVKHVGTLYNILAVLPDETGKQFIDLVCEVVK